MKKIICHILIATILIMSLPLIACADEELKNYEIDFSSFSDEQKATPGTIMSAITEATPFTASYSVRGSKPITGPGSSVYGEDWEGVYKAGNFANGKVLDGDKNNVLIEGEQLVLKRDFTYTEGGSADSRFLTLTLDEPITGGGVLVKFNIDLKTELLTSGYHTSFIPLMDESSKTICTFNIYGNKFYLKGKNESSWNADSGLLTGGFGVGMHSVEMAMDLDNGTAHVMLDGVSCGTREINAINQLSIIRFGHMYTNGAVRETMDIGLSGISISQIEKPAIVETNVTDGQKGAVIDAPVFKFNIPMNPKAIGNISLYANDAKMENAEFSLSEDGQTLMLLTPLNYSTPYRIEFGKDVSALNGLNIPQQSYSFHTGHKPALLTYNNDFAFLDSESQPITALTGGANVCAQASFTNASDSDAQQVMLILALYSDDEIMESIKLTTVSIAKGETAQTVVNMTMPEDVSGKTLRAYAWDGYGSANIIMTSQFIN